ncbi:MAG: hypothetical protein Q9M10_03225 [Mariprofundaceae bacterium]|nr:hypothetical protein [Mariprofundaceae bacterium]
MILKAGDIVGMKVSKHGQPSCVPQKTGNYKGSPLRQRKPIRLKGYDYSSVGLYFITIYTQNRLHFFGEIVNDVGSMIEKLWREISNHFKNTRLHEYIIMPNHTHGIIEVSSVAAPLVGAQNDGQFQNGQPQGVAPTCTIIGGIVGAFKSLSTNEYTHIVQYIMDNPQTWTMDQLNVGGKPL